MRPLDPLLALDSVAGTAGPLCSQQTLHASWTGIASLEHYGHEVEYAGDVDLDGHPEVLLGTWDEKGLGRAQVVSPHSGAVLHEFHGQTPGARYGFAMATIGDVDQDGFPDLAIGEYLAPGHVQENGRVEVRSGRTGQVLYEVLPEEGGQFGFSIAALGGDVDGDGVPDFVVGAPEGTAPIQTQTVVIVPSGYAAVVSGQSGKVNLRVGYHAPNEFQAFGFSVAGIGDLNDDGKLDFAVGAPWHDAGAGGWRRGGVAVFNASDGAPIGVVEGASDDDHLGISVAAAGDVDGDGYDDYIAGAPLAEIAGQPYRGYAAVISGRNGTTLASFAGTSAYESYGYDVDRPGDFNRDGVADFAFGAPSWPGLGPGPGVVHVHDGKTFDKLWEITVSAPTPPVLSFGAALAAAGDIDGGGLMDMAVGAPEMAKEAGLVEFVLLDLEDVFW